MSGYSVYRLEEGSPVLVGTLGELGDAFSYDLGYLVRADAKPLSLSLPLGGGSLAPSRSDPISRAFSLRGRRGPPLPPSSGLPRRTGWASLLPAGGSAPATSSSVIPPVCQGRAEMDTSRLTRAS